VISDGIAKRVAPGSQEHALVPAGSADGGWGDGSHARLPVALMHADVQQEREQMRALLLEIRLWLEHHEPSSPITILLKQADRMWGKRFSEVAHMIPPDLMQAWDRED